MMILVSLFLGSVVSALLVILWRTVGGVLLYFLFARFKNCAARRLIPQLGHFQFLDSLSHGGVERFYAALRALAERGSGTFPPLAFVGTARVGSQVIAVCSADGLRDVLTKTDVFAKHPEMYGAFGPLLGRGLVTNEEHALWHAQRRRLTPMFHLGQLRSYVSLINDEARALCVELLAHNGKQLNIAPVFADSTLRLIVRAVFGKRLDNERVSQLWRSATNGLVACYWWTTSAMPAFLLPIVPSGLLHGFLSACMDLDKLFVAAVKECRRSETQAAVSFDLVAQMALLKDEQGHWLIPINLIADECKTLTFAAHDTTSNLLAWCVFFLGQNAALQVELVAESVSVLGSFDAEVVAVEALKLHRAVLLETLRLRPPVPILMRIVTRDTELCGVPIEKNTSIAACVLAPQTSSEHYTDPLSFRPHRWIDGSLGERHPFAFAAFSAGPRNCIGQKLALNEATIILSHLLRRFVVHVDNVSEVQQVFRGTVEPQGMKTRLTARD